jgi:hypothetical protein
MIAMFLSSGKWESGSSSRRRNVTATSIARGMSSGETSVRLSRTPRVGPSEAPENVTQNHHFLRSATLPRAINRLTQLAESRGGWPLVSHLCVPRPLARCRSTHRLGHVHGAERRHEWLPRTQPAVSVGGRGVSPGPLEGSHHDTTIHARTDRRHTRGAVAAHRCRDITGYLARPPRGR